MIRQSRFVLNAAKASLLILVLLLVAAVSASAQVQLGTPKYESFGGDSFDTVNLGLLNVYFSMPIFHKPGRGLPFNFDLMYNSTFWQPVQVSGQWYWNNLPAGSNQQYSTNGWSGSALSIGSLLWSYSLTACYYPGDSSHTAGFYACYYYNNFDYVDGAGVDHPFSGFASYLYTIPHDYPLQGTVAQGGVAFDGSGYSLNFDAANGAFSVYTAEGNLIVPANTLLGTGSPASVVDRNGNAISESSNGTFTDTLGAQVLTTSGASPNPYVMTYTDANGHAASATLTWASYTVQTDFGCSNIVDFPATSGYLKDRLTLPNGKYYQFNYEATAGHPGNVTGRLASVTLPSGGTIYYTYTGGSSGYNVINCSDGSPLGLTRQTPDGSWTYVRSINLTSGDWTTTITDPGGNQTVIQFATGLGLAYEQLRQVYLGSASSGTVLETVTTCYDGNTTNCVGAAGSLTLPLSQRAITTQLGSMQSEHVYSYDAYGNPTETDDYDWGSGAVGPVLKKTVYSYASLDKIKSFAQTVTVCSPGGTDSACNGSGTKVAQTTYNYDGSALQATSGVPQHFNPPGASRGNLTSVQRWLNTTGGNVTSSTVYYDTGVPYTTTDPNHFGGTATTTYAYSSSSGNAYPTQITNALGQLTQYGYYSTGSVSQIIDPNNQVTSFLYDNMQRQTQVNHPDGGRTTNCYFDEGGTTCAHAGNPNILTTTKITSSTNLVVNNLVDGLGRLDLKQVTSDPEGMAAIDYTTYDALGRTASVSNPHRTASATTDGTTSYQYDALGRTTRITQPDGSTINTSYSGNCATVTDEAGKTQESCADALGRITGLWEDPAGLNYETDYTYDAQGNLTQVQQKGGSSNSSNWRTRTFTYDSLSRLLSASNPESGSVTYAYDANGNVLTKTLPAPNQIGSATVTISNCYDALNRVTAKGYTFSPNTPPTCNNGTLPSPAATYLYDVATVDGFSSSYPKGRLVKAATTGTSPAVTYYSYDSIGRITNRSQCVVINSCGTSTPTLWAITSTYDLAGNLTSFTDARGDTFTQSFDAASRPVQLTSSWVDPSHPATLFTVDPSAGYYASGDLQKATMGNGLIQTNVLNPQLQPCRLATNSTGTPPATCTDSNTGDILDFSYGYNAGSADNGNVASWSAVGNQTFSRSYTYDSLNRLATFSQSSGSAQGCGSVFSLSWGIDPWGNRTDQNVTAGTCNPFHQAVNTQNKFSASPYSYDAAGNLLADGVHSYSYDAENRLQNVDSGSAAVYIYDADGRRVGKTAGSAVTYYLYGGDGQVVSERDSSNNWLQTYIHFGGTLLAVYRGTVTGFLHQDRLGSTRLVTLADKSVYDNMDFLAFGEQIEGGSGVTHKFTGAERDGTVTTETGFDYMQARHYSSLFGRFLTPDPVGMAAADLTNPQSLNQYAYVMNNPANMTDPTGTDPWDEMGGSWGGGWGGSWGGFGGPPMIPNWSGIPLPGPGQGLDPASMIIDNFTNVNGIIIGDENGEQLCTIFISDNSCGGYMFWSSWTGKWQPNRPRPTLEQQRLQTIGAAMAPLNKLDDCAGNAVVSNFVPFGDKMVKNNIKTPLDSAQSGLDKIEDVGTAAKHSERISRLLNQIELPNIAEKVAKHGPKVGPWAERLGPLGVAVSAGAAGYQTYACYNRVGN